MPLRLYLQDWDKAGLDETEVFALERSFECPPSFGQDIEPIEDVVLEDDEVLVDVIEGVPPPEPELLWEGFVVFSDVHSCTAVGDSQQSTNLRLVDYVDCDAPECGGPGGWLAWWSNDPEHHPDHPDNPLAPFK